MTRAMQRIGVLLGAGQLVLGCDSGKVSGGSEPLSCSATEVDCGDGCVSLVANSSHCGACSHSCLAGQICVESTCACPGGGLLCEATCVDPQDDDAHCGSCENACPHGFSCKMGHCREVQNDGSGGLSTGGASTGGAATGGAAGGVIAGGISAGGAGGEVARGFGGWGGDGPGGQGFGGSDDSESPGCTTAPPPDSGRYSIDVLGDPRDYLLKLPDDYDPDRPHALVVAWHWLGGTPEQVARGVEGSSLGPFYGLEEQAGGQAIFVAPEGIDGGWANPGGRDVAFARDLVERLEEAVCVDTDRIFSTGFSYGGMMSNAIGCAMPEVFRAIAPVSGSLWSGCEAGIAPIAVWSAHGIGDGDVPLDEGREARDEFLGRNGCSNVAVPTDPDPCVAYEDCRAGQPVVWCEWDGGHVPPSFAPAAIWEFFTGLP